MQEIEEELSVGKRKVATGGVRVTTSVSETPVEETVTLRQEQVEAERQPVDRTLSAEEAEAAFEGKTVEMMGTSEEAEITKQARVVGEVALGKTVEERERDGEGHGAPHRGRGRGGRGQGAQEPLSTPLPDRSFSGARRASAGLLHSGDAHGDQHIPGP